MSAENCSKKIYDGAFRGRLCTNPAKVERDGKRYCGIHDPEKVESRRIARNVKWGEENKVHQANRRMELAAPAMYEALNLIIAGIPQRRDWLDPDVEKKARAALRAAKSEKAGTK